MTTDHPAPTFDNVGHPSAGCHGQAQRRHVPPDEGAHAGAFGLGMPHNLTIKIADFGLARMVSSQTRMTLPDSLLGTPEYMSPEQARGDENIDHRTDLYSAGVVLYEMLTGRTPFKADTPSAVIHQILHTEPSDPRTISTSADARLAQIAQWLLAKEASERPANARRVVTVLAGGRIPVSRRTRRRAAWCAASATAVLAVAGLAFWLIPQLVRPRELGRPPATPSERITGVDVDEHTIIVQRGHDTSWKKFTEVSAQINAAEYVDVNDRGGQIVVVGCEKQLDDEGSVLAAFDSSANKLWQIPLHSTMQWPDDVPPKRWYRVQYIVKGELDGVQGEELLVVAMDEHDYPCRVSVVDPLTGDIGTTFWHFGDVSWIRIVDKFFEDDRPAIFALAYNNKLDGFRDGPRDGETHFTQWPIVRAVMILDPATMDGLSPPLTDRVSGISPASPWAYAFLDFPEGDVYQELHERRPSSEQGAVNGTSDWFVWIENEIHETIYSCPEGAGPAYMVYTGARTSDGKPRSVGNPVLDRNLGLCRVGAIKSTSRFTQEQAMSFWRLHWRPLFQEGRYVGDRLRAQSGDE